MDGSRQTAMQSLYRLCNKFLRLRIEVQVKGRGGEMAKTASSLTRGSCTLTSARRSQCFERLLQGVGAFAIEGYQPPPKALPLLYSGGSKRKTWQGRKDSNPRMPESESGALTSLATPLAYCGVCRSETECLDPPGVRLNQYRATGWYFTALPRVCKKSQRSARNGVLLDCCHS
jgi:hypothetical protein